ncbi:hypothetical protein RDI58_029157 [Solanum bulbocastanum]|uniref:Uncharacterized protein n=1 Tax=Solanum bulbocastanum TaxID=147425 RepID=A0AAN8SWY6_SOLBU
MEKQAVEEEVEEEAEQDAVSVHSPNNLHLLFFIWKHMLLMIFCRSINRQYAPDDILKLLDYFYNSGMVKPEDEDVAI